MEHPKISVIIPTYKRPDILCRAIDSVLIQDFKDYEIIIIDDNGLGSVVQKETEKLMRQKYLDQRIYYIPNEKSLGGGGARNVGITAAKGEFIAFLDDDEDWLPGKLSKQMKKYSECTENTGVIDTGVLLIKENGEKIYRSPEMQGWIFEDLLSKSGKSAPKLSTILCRKSVLEKVGLFDSAFRSRQDLDLYIRLSRVCKFDSINEPLAYKRYDADSRISTNIYSKLQGYELLYFKNIDEFKKRPKIHADYLIKYSMYLVENSLYFKASKNIIYAFCLVKFNPIKILNYSKKISKKIYYKITVIRKSNK